MLSGILVLLFVMGMFFLQAACWSSRAARARTTRAQAVLAAGSGMEYAAARLTRQGAPRASGSAADRGDDWTFRDGTGKSLGGASNPSYAHGECWRDLSIGVPDGADNDADTFVDEADEIDGIWAPGDLFVPAAHDRDGDGRFSAFSGRLRGGGRPSDLRFSLKISSPEGRIPINAGCLDLADSYGGINGKGEESGNGDPDHQDIDKPSSTPTNPLTGIQYHRGLALTLNNLGVVLGIGTRREDIQTGSTANNDNWVRTSWLGYDLIRNRPVGGYKSWADVEQALKTLSMNPTSPVDHRRGGTYTQADLDLIKPYLDLGPYDPLSEAGRTRGYDRAQFPVYVPINLHCAGREVLTSLWMNLACYVPAMPASAAVSAYVPFPGEINMGQGWMKPCTRTATLPYFSMGAGTAAGGDITRTLTLFRPEAQRLAERLLCLRGREPLTWQALHAEFMAGAAEGSGRSIFLSDYNDLAGFPTAQRNWCQGKAALAYQAVTIDPYPFPTAVGSVAWAAGWPVPGNPFPRPVVGFSEICRIQWPPSFQEPGFVWKDPITGAADPMRPYKFTGDPIKPQGGTVSPPCRFDVESMGYNASGSASALLQGSLRTAEWIHLTSQEEFERFTEQKNLRDQRRITALDDPVPRDRRVWIADGGRNYPHVASLPRWNRRDFTAAAEGTPYFGFSRTYGALGLASRENGLGSADLYFPFSEDFDNQLDGAGPPPDSSEFWAEKGGGYTGIDLRFPVADKAYIEDKMANLTPWQISGGGLPIENFPGIDLVSGIQSVSIEFWATPGSSFVLQWGSSNLELKLSRTQIDTYYYATSFLLSGTWNGQIVGGGANAWIIADGIAPEPPVPTWNYHVVLTADVQGVQTVFSLYVNGTNFSNAPVAAMTYPHPAAMVSDPSGKPEIVLTRIDELRLYGRDPVLSAGEVAALYAGRTRFTPSGQYRSPLYRLDGQAGRISQVQWNGILPAGLPASSMTVEVTGCRADGTPLWVPPRTLGPWGPPEDLSGEAPVEAFRYQVDLAGASGIQDTPIFESISFQIQRPGRTGWTAWSAR